MPCSFLPWMMASLDETQGNLVVMSLFVMLEKWVLVFH